MLDAQISLLNYMATMYLMSGRVPERIGNAHFVHVPVQHLSDQRRLHHHRVHRRRLLRALHEGGPAPELLKPEYLKQPVRYADRARIDAVIGEELGARIPRAHWLGKLREARIPCGPVNDFAQALSDPQVLARNMVVEVPIAGGGSVRMPGNPMKFSESTDPSPTAPPRLGEHTQSVLGALGYDAERLQALAAAGVIA